MTAALTQLSHEIIEFFYTGREGDVYGLETKEGNLIKGVFDDTDKFCTMAGIFIHIYKKNWIKLKNYSPLYHVSRYQGFAVRKIVEINEFREFCTSLKNRKIRRK